MRYQLAKKAKAISVEAVPEIIPEDAPIEPVKEVDKTNLHWFVIHT